MEKSKIYEDRYFKIGSNVDLDDKRRAIVKEISVANYEYIVELEDSKERITVTLTQFEDF